MQDGEDSHYRSICVILVILCILFRSLVTHSRTRSLLHALT